MRSIWSSVCLLLALGVISADAQWMSGVALFSFGPKVSIEARNAFAGCTEQQLACRSMGPLHRLGIRSCSDGVQLTNGYFTMPSTPHRPEVATL
jgi:hypothetical protein